MASWPEVKEFIGAGYSIIKDAGSSVTVELEVLPGRPRTVVLTHQTLLAGYEEWVVIESPFAELGQVDLMDAARLASEMVCGGIGTLDGTYATVRHAVPLAHLPAEDFERPFHLVIGSADALESELGYGIRV